MVMSILYFGCEYGSSSAKNRIVRSLIVQSSSVKAQLIRKLCNVKHKNEELHDTDQKLKSQKTIYRGRY